MSKYRNYFYAALDEYKQQSERPGYVFGWLSSFRHSKKLYPHIEKLQTDLVTAKTDIEESKILHEYFQSVKTKYNNHSFAIYLLDKLVENFPYEQWEKFYPKEKRVEFYIGNLYRGSLQTPDDALKHGIRRYSSNKIEDYANDTNLSTGVSTSKKKEIAERYQKSVFQTNNRVYVEKGYLYKIHYRGAGGVDIIETLKARGNYLTADMASHKEEVNIVGEIPASDIVGYWDTEDVYHENPGYDQDKQAVQSETFPERLKVLFKK